MEELTPLIGRDAELGVLKQHLADAMSGKGTTVLISGEPGIGKTALAEEFRKHAEAEGARILSGAAMSGAAHPFQVFSRALEGLTDRPLFEEQEYTSFTEIFAVNGAGLLLAKASSEEGGLDADIFAGMLSAVQDFVRDSFGQDGGKAGLGRLEYGDMKILIEHGQHLFLTAVFSGNEHPDMKNTVKRALKSIEEDHGRLIQGWTGKMSEVEPVQDEITRLAGAKFLVRKDLEGVKLENERVRIADRALETLTNLSGEKALLLFLEDLHWTDRSSLFVLNYLTRNIRQKRLMILGTLRQKESPALENTRNQMDNEGLLKTIDLAALAETSVTDLVDSICSPNELPNKFTEDLAKRCTGNPLFIKETLRHLVETGKIGKRNGIFTLLNDDFQLPGNVEDIINRRIENLTSQEIAMAEYSSCLGPVFDTQAALSLSTVKDGSSALASLENAGILIRHNGNAEFVHGIFQDVVYRSIGKRWRQIYHRSLGEYYEKEYESHIEDVLYELARHFSNSSDHEKSFTYSLRAGEKAESAFAPEEANEFYKNALGAIRGVGGQYFDMVAEINYRLGTLNSLTGDFEPAISYLTEAIDLENDEIKRARYYKELAFVYDKSGKFQNSIEMCHIALNELGDREVMETAMILNRLGWAYMRTDDYKKALEQSLKGLAIAEKIENKSMIAEAHSHMGPIYWHLGDQARALEHLKKSLDIRNEIGDIRGASNCYNNMANIYMHKGDLNKALDYNLKSLEIKKKIKEKAGVSVSLNNLGNVYLKMNMLDKALEYYLQSLEIKEMIGDPHGIAMTYNNIGILHKNMGNYEKSIEYHEKGLELRRQIQNKHGIASSLANIGATYIEMGEHEKSINYLEEGLEICNEIKDRRISIESLQNFTKAYIGLGDYDKALDYAGKALDDSIELKLTDRELDCRSAIARIHRLRGDLDTSKKEFDELLDMIEAHGEVENQNEIYYEIAQLYIARNEPKKARGFLEKSLSTSERLGMNIWADKCRKALAELNQ